MGHVHRAGSLKQRNKPFKKRTGAAAPVSAAAFRAAENRKATAAAIAAAVRPVKKQQRDLQTKHKRMHQLQRLQQLKQSLRGAAACGHAALPPRVVLVVSFNKAVPSAGVCAALAEQLAADAPAAASRSSRSSPAAKAAAAAAAAAKGAAAILQQNVRTDVQAGTLAEDSPAVPAAANAATAAGAGGADFTVYDGSSLRGDWRGTGETAASRTEMFLHALPAYACCPSLPQRAQQRLLLLPAPPPEELLQLLSLCSCADLLLCVFAGECTYTAPAFDEDGYRFLAALKMQGVPPVAAIGLSSTTVDSIVASSSAFYSSSLCREQQQQQQLSQHPLACGVAETRRDTEMETPAEGDEAAQVTAPAAGQHSNTTRKDKDGDYLRFQQRYFLSEFGADKGFVSVRTPGDWRKVLRAVGSAHIPLDVAAAPAAAAATATAAAAAGELHWRAGRGYLLALDWRLLTEQQLQEQQGERRKQQEPQQQRQEEQQQQGQEQVEKLYLQVDGFVRGVGFTKRLPVHVTGVGDFIAQRIEVLHRPASRASRQLFPGRSTSSNSSSSGVEFGDGVGAKVETDVSMVEEGGDRGDGQQEDTRGVEELDCEELSAAERTELLQQMQPLQPFDRSSLEQTWPTDAELREAEEEQQQQGKGERPRRQQQGPQEPEEATEKMSEASDVAAEEESGEQSDDEEGDAWWDEEFASSNSNHEQQNPPVLRASNAKRNFTIEQRAAEDLEFPDEVDTPLDAEARVRFQKYRGLKSFRTSTWNRDTDLPLEYSRVVDFQRFKGLQKYAYATLRNLCARNIFHGRLCRITIPLHLTPLSLDPAAAAAASAAAASPAAASAAAASAPAAPASAGAASAAAASAGGCGRTSCDDAREGSVAAPSSICCSGGSSALPSSGCSSPGLWEQLLLRCSAQPLLQRTVHQLRQQLAGLPPLPSSLASSSSFSSAFSSTAAPPSCPTAVSSLSSSSSASSLSAATAEAVAAAAAGSCAAAGASSGGAAADGAGSRQLLPGHLVLSTVLPFETAVSVVHLSLTRGGIDSDVQKRSIKSKEELLFACGFRRFVGRPIFSTVAATSGSGGTAATEKAKFLPFFHPSSSCIASLYCCTMFPPTPVLVFVPNNKNKQQQPQEQQQSQEPQQQQACSSSTAAAAPIAPAAVHDAWQVCAWGSVLHSSSNRIILKRIILTGYPFRVHKRKAVVRYMFFNPRDIRWFMPVELHTKKGLRGNILQPLGTHGYMKCRFNLPVKQDDTVCMHLYKRVFPKWYPPAWNGLVYQQPTNDYVVGEGGQENQQQQQNQLQQQKQLQQQNQLQQQQQPRAVCEDVEMLAA